MAIERGSYGSEVRRIKRREMRVQSGSYGAQVRTVQVKNVRDRPLFPQSYGISSESRAERLSQSAEKVVSLLQEGTFSLPARLESANALPPSRIPTPSPIFEGDEEDLIWQAEIQYHENLRFPEGLNEDHLFFDSIDQCGFDEEFLPKKRSRMGHRQRCRMQEIDELTLNSPDEVYSFPDTPHCLRIHSRQVQRIESTLQLSYFFESTLSN